MLFRCGDLLSECLSTWSLTSLEEESLYATWHLPGLCRSTVKLCCLNGHLPGVQRTLKSNRYTLPAIYLAPAVPL